MMTKELDELNKRFQILKEAAAKKCKELPNGFESQIDISCFNDLCKIYDNYAKGIFSKDETIKQGKTMRTNYVEATRDFTRKKIKIKRSGSDYIKAETALVKLNKECLTMTAEEREELYLDIAYVVEPIAAIRIRKQVKQAKNEQEKPKGAAVAELILKNKAVYCVYESDAEHYQKLYPGADVISELRKMQGWCESNPARRKTRKGIGKFITNWLASEQGDHAEPQESKATYDLDEFAKRSLNLKYKRNNDKGKETA